MRIPIILKAASAALIAVTSLVAHADQLVDIKKKGEIVIGYEIDLAKATAAKIGVKPVFKQIAVAARTPALQQGGVDLLAASLTHNKEREAQVDFSLTNVVTGQKALVKLASGIKNVPELAGKKVLTVKGGTQEPNTKKAVPTADVVTFENTQQAFQALQQGKGVAFVNDEASRIAAVDDTLRGLEKSGTAEKTFLQWYGPNSSLKFPKRNFKVDSDKVES